MSVLAAAVAVLVEVVFEVPVVAILIPVIVIAFALSWLVTGHQQHRSAP